VRYGSVCSGIEAASIAWESLGMEPAWFSQFDPEHNYKNGPDFPSAVLAHHWPDVPNHGDMTQLAAKVRSGEILAPDLLVGGTPCQAFSVAGARAGLSDSRGQLTISYGELADAIDQRRAAIGLPPAIIVWENVPGVLSSKDNAFGAFLGLLAGESCELQPPRKRWENAGYVRGPKRTIAWRILDAQYFGVAQRRRRVFVVASAGADIDPAKILFECDGVRRDIAPSRSAGEKAAGAAGNGVKVGSHCDNPANPHPTLNQSHNIGGIGQSNQELFSQRGCGIVGAYGMTAFGEYADDDTASTCKASNYKDATDLAVMARAVSLRGRDGGATAELGDEVSACLRASTGGGDKPHVLHRMVVRRLTPVECERLQGFPDNHTLIPVTKRKQITADEYAYLRSHFQNMTAEEAYRRAADGPRYKAIGNSMAVPVMRWIGRRIISHLNK